MRYHELITEACQPFHVDGEEPSPYLYEITAKSDLLWLTRQSQCKLVRGLLIDGRVLAWDAYAKTHDDMMVEIEECGMSIRRAGRIYLMPNGVAGAATSQIQSSAALQRCYGNPVPIVNWPDSLPGDDDDDDELTEASAYSEPKTRSKSPKSFTVAGNLVLQDGIMGSVHAFNGDPRNGGLNIGALLLQHGTPDDLRSPDCHIYKVAVKPPYQRKGVARAMYDAAEAHANARGGKLVPATSVSDEAFGFWNSWKPERIAYDGRHFDKHYVGKTVTYKDQTWVITHAAQHRPDGRGTFGASLADGSRTTRIPKQVVVDQLGDFYPKTD